MQFLFRCLLLWALGSAFLARAEDAKEAYARLCAGCHGASLEGGKGPTLLGPLRHGADATALALSTQKGFPLTGMPAFNETLDAGDILALVVFLEETRANRTVP